jgi:hypothetical protein
LARFSAFCAQRAGSGRIDFLEMTGRVGWRH